MSKTNNKYSKSSFQNEARDNGSHRKGKKNNSATRNKSSKVSKDRALVNTKSRGNSFESSFSDPSHYINRVVSSSNHPSWYTRNRQMIEDATKLSFFQQLGAKLKLDDDTRKYRIPGVMAFSQITCPGYSKHANDPASLAALQMYEFIRSSLNKPNPDYDAPDLLMYVGAVDDIFSQYVNILRLFGIFNTWSGDNLYTPATLINSIYGLNSDGWNDMLTNFANYQAQFNQLIYKASTFTYYPEAFTITDRHAWLFGNIFMDHDSHKSQYYAYQKFNWWLFNETKYDTGTCLEYHDMTEWEAAPTMQTYLDIFSESIEALRSSTLVRTIVTDMRQAFSDQNTLNMAYVDERFSIEPSYDAEALMQMENMDVLGTSWMSKFENKDVTQDPNENVVKYAPRYIQSDPDDLAIVSLNFSKIINLHTDDTSTDTIIEATRGMLTFAQDPFDGEINILPASDFCVVATIVDNPDTPWSGGDIVMDGPELSVNSLGQLSSGGVLLLSAWSAFDWAPKLYARDTNSELHPFYEWDHYTVIDTETNTLQSTMTRMNRAALLSMWSIPEFGAFNPGS